MNINMRGILKASTKKGVHWQCGSTCTQGEAHWERFVQLYAIERVKQGLMIRAEFLKIWLSLKAEYEW